MGFEGWKRGDRARWYREPGAWTKRLSSLLIFTIFLEILAPVAWALPEPEVTRDPAPRRATRKVTSPTDPQLAKVLRGLGQFGQELPGEDGGLEAHFPHPELLAQNDPEPANPEPEESPSTTGESESAPDPEAEKPKPKRFPVPNWKPKPQGWDAWEPDEKDRHENPSKPANHQPQGHGHGQVSHDGVHPDRDGRHEDLDRDDDDHYHHSSSQLAYLRANVEETFPPFEFSRQTEPGGRFYQTTPAGGLFSTDYLFTYATTIKSLDQEETLALDFLAPTGAQTQNQTSRGTAASCVYHYTQLSGSRPSALNSRYRLTVTEYNSKWPHGHTKFRNEEPMLLSQIKMSVSAALRDQGDWQMTLTRNGQPVSTQSIRVQDPPFPTDTGWRRRVNGSYKPLEADSVAWTNDEMLVHRSAVPIPAFTGPEQQVFNVRWDLKAPESDANRSQFHTYWTLQETYTANATAYSTVTRIFDETYPTGKIWQQTAGNGTLTSLPVAYGRGLSVPGKWTFTQKSGSEASQTSTLDLRQLDASVAPLTPSFFTEGTLPLQAHFQAFPSSYIPEKLNWTVTINDAGGQPLRALSGSFTDNTDNAKDWIVPWDGKDSQGNPVASGRTLSAAISVGVPVVTPTVARRTASLSASDPGVVIDPGKMKLSDDGSVLTYIGPTREVVPESFSSTTRATAASVAVPQPFTLTMAFPPESGGGFSAFSGVTGNFLGQTITSGTAPSITGHFLSISGNFYIFARTLSLTAHTFSPFVFDVKSFRYGDDEPTVITVQNDLTNDRKQFSGLPNLEKILGRSETGLSPEVIVDQVWGGQPPLVGNPIAQQFTIPPTGNWATLAAPNTSGFSGYSIPASNYSKVIKNTLRVIHIDFGLQDVEADILFDTEAQGSGQAGTTHPICECNSLCQYYKDMLRILTQWGWLSSPIPIRVSNGSGRYYHQFTDLAIPTQGLPLTLARLYSSEEDHVAPSFGWKWDFQDQLIIEPNTQVIYRSNVGAGQFDHYEKAGDLYVSHGENTNVLTKVDDRHYKITSKNHTQTVFEVAPGVDTAVALPYVANLKQKIDNNGNANTFTWNSTGKRLLRMEGPNPSQYIKLQWSNDRGPDKAFDHTGRAVVYRYQQYHQEASRCDGPSDWVLSTVIQPGCKTYTNRYHRVLGQRTYQLLTMALNGTLQEKVIANPDSPGVLQEVTHRLGATYTFERDNSGVQPTTKVTMTAENLALLPGGQAQEWNYTLDEEGTVVAGRDIQGHSESVVFDENHNPTSARNALGQQAHSTFDARNNPLTQTDNQGRTTTMVWSADDTLQSVTDSRGQTTSMTYSPTFNLESMTDPAHHTSRITYTPFGKPASITDNLGHTRTFSYNSLGFLNGATSPPAAPGQPAATASFSVDSLGRRILARDPLGRVAKFRFDERNHLVETTIPAVSARYRQEHLPEGHITAHFDNNDLLLSSKALDGLVTGYDYDSAHRLVAVHEPGTHLPTRLKYDALENLIEMVNTNGQSTFYQRDNLNRLVKTIYPGGDSESFGFDAQSNLVTWSRGNNVVSYTYDNLNRLQHLSCPATQDDIQLTYDQLDRVATMTDNSGTTAYTYTDNYLLDSIVRPGNRKIRYFYDQGDRLQQSLDPEGLTTDYTYSDRDELTRVTHDGNTVSTQYDLVGRPTSVQMSNGVQCRNAFSERDQLLFKEYVRGANPLISLRYAFNQVGQRVLDDRRTAQGTILKRYCYNDRRELVSSSKAGPGHQHSEKIYKFDQNSNITNYNGTFLQNNSADQLTRAGNSPLGYNAAGQATTVAEKSLTFGYNDQIKSVHGPGVSAQYLYDGSGQRVQKTVDGRVQKFLWNGGNIAKEYRADGSVRADYQLGAGAKIEGQWQFYLSDIQGSTLAVTDQSGNIKATWDYSDFGVTTQTSGDHNLYQPFLYTHQELDAETGFYHNRARHYAPALGRFLARDPIGYAGGANLYSYCGGDPINFADPSGHNPLLIGLAIAVGFEAYNYYNVYPGITRDSRVNKYGNWTASPSGKGGFWRGNAVDNSWTLVAPLAPTRLPGLGSAAAEAEAVRGMSEKGIGIFSSTVNGVGGRVWTSQGGIVGRDIGSLVNGGLYEGEVNILSGVHGYANGAFEIEARFLAEDLARFGNIPGVTVHNFADLTMTQLTSLVNGNGTTIAGFCNSEAVLKFMGVMK